jgi:hypothetical protein
VLLLFAWCPWASETSRESDQEARSAPECRLASLRRTVERIRGRRTHAISSPATDGFASSPSSMRRRKRICRDSRGNRSGRARSKRGRQELCSGDLAGIAVGFGSVWVLDSTRGTVVPIEEGTGTLPAPVDVGNALAVGLGAVWVTTRTTESSAGSTRRRGRSPRSGSGHARDHGDRSGPHAGSGSWWRRGILSNGATSQTDYARTEMVEAQQVNRCLVVCPHGCVLPSLFGSGEDSYSRVRR